MKIVSELKKLPQYLKPYFPLFTGCMVFSTIIYFILMANQLVNPFDGLWEYSYYTAGYWELSLGRWAWLYLDQLRMGISFDPLTSLITLSCFSVGILLIIDLFNLRESKLCLLICGLFLSSTSVCISLSYRYMSPTFGMAFLLNVLAAWILCKFHKLLPAILISGFLIAVAMGLYQANIGCACIVVLGYWIYTLLQPETTLKETLQRILCFLLSGGLGALLYLGILKLHLWFFHTSLSSYNGANSYSIANTLLNFPKNIGRAYDTFWQYFTGNYYLSNIFQKYKLFIIVLAVIALFLTLSILCGFRKSKGKALLAPVLLFAIPIACNAVSFIATDTHTSMQMTTPLALCLPVLLCVTAGILRTLPRKFTGLFYLQTALLLVVLYGNIYQVQIDQNALLEGKIATTTLATEIVHDVHKLGYIAEDKEFCVIGLPIYNPLFQTSELYNHSNVYARFGSWWTDTTCTRRSWQGVFSYLCGADLKICSAPKYNELLATETIQNMPVYPAEGSIAEVNDVVVIKVSP